MLSPGQRDENPGHHTSKQNVKTTSVCVSVLFSAATIVDLYSKNRALYCQNKIMLVCIQKNTSLLIKTVQLPSLRDNTEVIKTNKKKILENKMGEVDYACSL